MNYLLAFIALDLINPWGLDTFILPKIWAMSLLILWYQSKKEMKLTLMGVSIFFACIFMLLLSMDWNTSLLGCELLGFQGLIQILVYYEVFRIGSDDLYRPGRAKDAPGEAILLFLVPMLVYAVLQRLGVDYGHPTWHIPYHRAVSTQGNPVFLSIVIGMLFPLVISFEQRKWAYWSLIGLVVAGLWAANSKSGILAASAGTIFYATY